MAAGHHDARTALVADENRVDRTEFDAVLSPFRRALLRACPRLPWLRQHHHVCLACHELDIQHAVLVQLTNPQFRSDLRAVLPLRPCLHDESDRGDSNPGDARRRPDYRPRESRIHCGKPTDIPPPMRGCFRTAASREAQVLCAQVTRVKTRRLTVVTQTGGTALDLSAPIRRLLDPDMRIRILAH